MAVNEVMCPYCGEMISEKATVCRHCGRILTGGAEYRADGTGEWYGAAPDQHTGAEAEKLRRKSRRTFWIVVLLCIALVGGAFALLSMLTFNYASQHGDELEDWVEDLIESDDIDVPIPVLGDYKIFEELADDYMEALKDNDPARAFALFPAEVQEYYDNDAQTLLSDMDENFPLYGTDVDTWIITQTADVDEEDVAELESSLPIGIERGEVLEVLVTPDKGEPFFVYLLLVKANGDWNLYYAY